MYLRLGKNGEPAALPQGSTFEIGRARCVRDGGDVAIASCGPMLTEALGAADLLAADGVAARVVHFGHHQAVRRRGRGRGLHRRERRRHGRGAHGRSAASGSAVAETLAEAGCGARLRRIGMPDCFAHAVGSRDHLIRHYGLDAAAVAAAARRAPGSTTERAAA